MFTNIANQNIRASKKKIVNTEQKIKFKIIVYLLTFYNKKKKNIKFM